MSQRSADDSDRTLVASGDTRFPTSIGRYTVKRILGRGAQGAVYHAFDPVLQRDVAIKFLGGDDEERNAAREGRLLAEARAAGRLNHPHVVTIHEFGEDAHRPYVVLEYVDGGNAGDRLSAQQGPPDWVEATRLVVQIARALAEAHRLGMVHRDIKPENIMLTKDGVAKLGDFGLAKLGDAENSMTLTGHVVGTPRYMSPEQCEGRSIDARTDVYALGATWYALLTATAPYAESTDVCSVMYKHCHGERPDPRTIVPDLPEGCTTVIRKAMACLPEDRYENAAEMQIALEEVLAGRDPVEAPKAPRPNRIGQLVAAAVFAAVLVVGVPFVLRPPTGPGVDAETVYVGMSAPFSGPNRDLGTEVALGIELAFRQVNENGGLHGRRVELVALDDGYEPQRTITNLRELIGERGVFAVLGSVGTPTAKAALPLLTRRRIPFFAPISGAMLLREDPPNRYVFNFRASYAEETAAIVRTFVDRDHIPARKIAVLIQDDAYGQDGLHGVERIMLDYGVEPDEIHVVRFKRNQVRADAQVRELVGLGEDLGAVVMVATYKIAARTTIGLRRVGRDVPVGMVSFVGARALAEEFQELDPQAGDGVLVTQVVPIPHGSATGVLRYHDTLAEYRPQASPSFLSLEGFIAGQLFCEVLGRCEGELTREEFVRTAEQMDPVDLGIGGTLQFRPSQHQASDRVWGTVLTADGEYTHTALR